MTLLDVRNLQVRYTKPAQWPWQKDKAFTAVKGISFHVDAGETLALVGESGCGKSSTARAICGLTPLHAGNIQFDGANVPPAPICHRHIQFVFQDPYASLNPRRPIGASIAEPLINFKICSRSEAHQRAHVLLERVGLQAQDAQRFPHSFSGGQRQRIVIARAISINPRVLLCDEPVSALDVSIQARILTLLQELQHDMNLAMLFISHDLAVVRTLAHRVAVMYDGHIVEEAHCAELYSNPQHAYTKSLLSAVPIPDPQRERSRQRIHYTPENTL